MRTKCDFLVPDGPTDAPSNFLHGVLIPITADDQPTSVEGMRFSTAGVLLGLLVNLFSAPTCTGGLFIFQASHSKCLRLSASPKDASGASSPSAFEPTKEVQFFNRFASSCPVAKF